MINIYFEANEMHQWVKVHNYIIIQTCLASICKDRGVKYGTTLSVDTYAPAEEMLALHNNVLCSFWLLEHVCWQIPTHTNASIAILILYPLSSEDCAMVRSKKIPHPTSNEKQHKFCRKVDIIYLFLWLVSAYAHLHIWMQTDSICSNALNVLLT